MNRQYKSTKNNNEPKNTDEPKIPVNQKKSLKKESTMYTASKK